MAAQTATLATGSACWRDRRYCWKPLAEIPGGGRAGGGIMVSGDRNNLLDLWWLSLMPGLAITIVVMALNLFGD